MLGIVSGGFVQGNPVYDYDHSDYVGAYAQDNWRVRPNVTVNLGLRWEPFLPVQNTDSLCEPLRAGAVRSERAQHGLSAGAGRPDVPRRRGLSGERHVGEEDGAVRAARRRGLDAAAATSGPACARRGASSTTRRTCSSTRASRTTRRGARRSRSRTRPAASPIRISAIPGGNPFPALNTGWATQPFPAFGVYVNTPLASEADDAAAVERHACSISSATGWPSASYLGNHSSHLWRATELNPAVFGPGATTGEHQRSGACSSSQNSAQGQFYGTIGQLDDTGRANYGAMLLSLQRRLKNNLSVLSNYTLSKCMSDPATTEITGPTIVEPGEPGSRLLPTARRIAGTSSTCRWWCGRRTSRTDASRAILSDWQLVADRPLAVGQPLDDHDRRRQRADGHGRPARGAGARRSVRHRRLRPPI